MYRCVFSFVLFSPLPNFDLHAAAAVVMADIPGVGNTDEKQLPSLKEIYVGFSDMVRTGTSMHEMVLETQSSAKLLYSQASSSSSSSCIGLPDSALAHGNLENMEETYTSSLFQTEPLYQFYDTSLKTVDGGQVRQLYIFNMTFCGT